MILGLYLWFWESKFDNVFEKQGNNNKALFSESDVFEAILREKSLIGDI